MSHRDNPSFTYFADDALAWEPIAWLPDELLGQCFKLVVYGCKLGGSLPTDHPLLRLLDPKVLELCTVLEGDRVLVVRPHDLPRLMASRRRWRESRRAGADAAGRDEHGRFKGAAHADASTAHADKGSTAYADDSTAYGTTSGAEQKGAPGNGTAHADEKYVHADEKSGVPRSPFPVPRSPSKTDTNERTSPARSFESLDQNKEQAAQELLDVCREIAKHRTISLTAAVQQVSAIPPSNNDAGKEGFSDPRAPGVSVPWIRTATARARQLRADLDRPVPL